MGLIPREGGCGLALRLQDCLILLRGAAIGGNAGPDLWPAFALFHQKYILHTLQGYLAHKKPTPPTTLQQDCA